MHFYTVLTQLVTIMNEATNITQSYTIENLLPVIVDVKLR